MTGMTGMTGMTLTLLLPLLVGLLIAGSAGPLGCFVIWRSSAYLTDGLSHVAVLGVALSLLLDLDASIGIAVICGLFGFLWLKLHRPEYWSNDTVIGILTAVSLALAATLFHGKDIDVHELQEVLFGSLATADLTQLLIVSLVSILVWVLLAKYFRHWLLVTISPELAHGDQTYPAKAEVWLTTTLILFVMIAVQIVGALLITAWLLLPAAAARTISKSPLQMQIISIVFAFVSLASGMSLAWLDIAPLGAGAVLCSSVIFGTLYLHRYLQFNK